MIPSVMMGKPNNLQQFNVVDIEDITVYINKNIFYNKELVDNMVRNLLNLND